MALDMPLRSELLRRICTLASQAFVRRFIEVIDFGCQMTGALQAKPAWRGNVLLKDIDIRSQHHACTKHGFCDRIPKPLAE